MLTERLARVYNFVVSAVVDELDEGAVSLEEFPALWAAQERTHARLALAAARFEASGEYGIDGAVTQAAWLRNRCRMSDTDASALLRLGRFLRNHEPVAEAAVESKLSAGQMRAMQINVGRTTEDVFAEQAEELIDIVAPLDVRGSEQVCKAWRQRAEAVTDQPEPSVPERELTCKRASDGSLVGRFVFDPALSAEFEKALGIAATWEGKDDTRKVGVRQADAMFDVFAFFNANHDREGTPRHRPHVELNVNVENLVDGDCCGTSTTGDPFAASTTDAFLCDAVIQRFTMAGSMPLDVGRITRVVPLDIFRAVAKRDGGCRFPGCDRKVAWCDAHHVVFWRHGGSTGIENLALLCARHHHLIHRPGWQLKLLPDATVEVTTPDGRVLNSEFRRRPRLRRIRPPI